MCEILHNFPTDPIKTCFTLQTIILFNQRSWLMETSEVLSSVTCFILSNPCNYSILVKYRNVKFRLNYLGYDKLQQYQNINQKLYVTRPSKEHYHRKTLLLIWVSVTTILPHINSQFVTCPSSEMVIPSLPNAQRQTQLVMKCMSIFCVSEGEWIDKACQLESSLIAPNGTSKPLPSIVDFGLVAPTLSHMLASHPSRTYLHQLTRIWYKLGFFIFALYPVFRLMDCNRVLLSHVQCSCFSAKLIFAVIFGTWARRLIPREW